MKDLLVFLAPCLVTALPYLIARKVQNFKTAVMLFLLISTVATGVWLVKGMNWQMSGPPDFSLVHISGLVWIAICIVASFMKLLSRLGTQGRIQRA